MTCGCRDPDVVRSFLQYWSTFDNVYRAAVSSRFSKEMALIVHRPKSQRAPT